MTLHVFSCFEFIISLFKNDEDTEEGPWVGTFLYMPVFIGECACVCTCIGLCLIQNDFIFLEGRRKIPNYSCNLRQTSTSVPYRWIHSHHTKKMNNLLFIIKFCLFRARAIFILCKCCLHLTLQVGIQQFPVRVNFKKRLQKEMKVVHNRKLAFNNTNHSINLRNKQTCNSTLFFSFFHENIRCIFL